ncbi:MAG: VWA domain-containing protein, partial [Pseudomonadota bacterium]
MLFAAGEGRLAALDGLVRALWLGGLTNSQGSLEPRLAALAALRRELLAGAAPSADD